MRQVSGIALLLVTLPLACQANGKLELERCAHDGFGEPRCDFTARHGRQAALPPPPADLAALGAIRRMQICASHESASPGTRAYRRCMRPHYATLRSEAIGAR